VAATAEAKITTNHVWRCGQRLLRRLESEGLVSEAQLQRGDGTGSTGSTGGTGGADSTGGTGSKAAPKLTLQHELLTQQQLLAIAAFLEQLV
jgi:hypothetical protein